jgi:hypothetical protein
VSAAALGADPAAAGLSVPRVYQIRDDEMSRCSPEGPN